jgi:heptosyltransferase-3
VRRLLIRPGALGDFILSLPALESLRTEYLEVWTPSGHVPLVRFADRVRSISSTGLDLLSITSPPPELVRELRGFDSIISWYGSNRAEFRAAVEDLGLPFHFLPALPAEDAGVHATDFYLGQVREIATRSVDPIPLIRCSRTAEPLEDSGSYAVIHPFSGGLRKNWPLEKFRALAARLERSGPVRWCSGPDDPPLDGAVQIPNLYDLACWLAGARLYIGNDSGVTHLAAAAGTPVLALFGPTKPEIWAPRGPHVRVGRWTSALQ